MNRKKWTGGAGIVAGLMAVCLLLAIAFAPAVARSDYSQYFTRPLIRYALYFSRAAGIVPDAANTGYVGTSSKPLGDIYVDSLRTGMVRLGASDTTGGPSGAVLLSVHNISGSGISAGDFTVWDDGPAVSVVSNGVKNNTSVTITGDLTDETANGGKLSLRVTVDGTSDSYDTLVVVGTDAYGSAQTMTLSITAGAGLSAATLGRSNTLTSSTSETYYWSSITSVNTKGISAANAVTITGYGYATIKASDGANTDFAGVAMNAIADDSIGVICVYGPVLGTVDAASLDAGPGVLLELASGGDAVTDASATTGQNIGRCLEYSDLDNYKIRVFLDSF